MESNLIYAKPSEDSDERYTPEYAVYPLISYIPEGSIVWCPFDTKESAFVRVLSQHTHVVHSHISEGEDFYTYEPPKYDMIISNPPFRNKRLILDRVLKLNVPFALLMTIVWLNDSGPFSFLEQGGQFMMFDKRIHYKLPDGSTQKKTTFSSAYYCRYFLPDRIVPVRLTRT